MTTEKIIPASGSEFTSIHQRLFAVAGTALLVPVIRAIPDIIFYAILERVPLLQLFFSAVVVILSILLFRLRRVAVFPACLFLGYQTYGQLSRLKGVNAGNAGYYYVATETLINGALIFILLYVWFSTRPKDLKA